ncbi:hypothetical protein allotria_92 [Salmonella phage allotria]|uniref:Uncharacterized protein n=3 Tax=Kuttervirus TaxID=2169536 RepID=A0A6G8RM01_9CAUD|nr:hypothetical protein HYQ31_gp092 [Salmonella phage allotria]YP_009888210.1 hypothetical protein HYQ33_gp094 [Salmonella phage aagejoakim]YP_009889227.1 hypothetical protein HYQ38_gp092 [Salmonella phage maane]ECW1086577.1 hypothetical protein [Salmonella enterica]QPX74827.1 hypothetical protein [Salmonella phage SilasIsHot]WDR21158.1 hypothetical protein PJM37_0079 [Salmonella phage vB_SenM_UTK0004]QIO02427.1 hypothetical protein allotria_92 [Salmonella phage allotria]QIO02692.1 hypotheti
MKMTNIELIRQAKWDLKVSLGHDDWLVLMNIEGRDIKMGRSGVLLTYHQTTKRWSAHIVGIPLEVRSEPSAAEAYIRLRHMVEKISHFLSGM